MKKVFLLAVATLIFAYQTSFASKNVEFTFGVERVIGFDIKKQIDYVDGKKVCLLTKTGYQVIDKPLFTGTNSDAEKFKKKMEQEVDINLMKLEITDNTIKTEACAFSGMAIAPKLEYCYYLLELDNTARIGIGLGVNKFFNSDFDPFNAYAIGKIAVLFNDEIGISFGLNVGYGIFNNKYENIKGTFKADKTCSKKLFVEFDYKNFFIDLSAMLNSISIDATINTQYEGVKRLEKNIDYDVIMLGIGYKFAI